MLMVLYDHLLSFLDHVVEHNFLTSSARQIIIFVATAEQLINQLQAFIPVIDSSISRIDWSNRESRKKLRLDLSLNLKKLVSFDFLNNIIFFSVLLFLIFI
jgi:hypothetical protein